MLLTQAMLDKYLCNDIVFQQLNDVTKGDDASFCSHQWLRDSAPKRLIYQRMYSDLMVNAVPRETRVLDVRGGYTALTRLLLRHCEYTLLDIMAHDDHEALRAKERELGRPFWENDDWFNFQPQENYGIILANDIFPNVDQRLGAFIEKYLPFCQELRLSLTYYNTPRWYRVKRTDGEEIFHMMAWDGVQTWRSLEPYVAHIQDAQLDILLQNPPSLFANGRQVCLVALRADKINHNVEKK